MAYRVLIVDDSPMYRVLLHEMFDILGHQVVGEADCAAAAVSAYQELKPDVVTLDVSLPDADGLSVLRELKRLDPDACVIMVTGNDQEKIVTQAKSLNALALLPKPFKKEKLAEVLAGIPLRKA